MQASAAANISISLTPWQPKFRLPMFSTLSCFLHVAFLTGGLWVARDRVRSVGGPTEFELVSVDAVYQSGHRQVEKKAKTTPQVREDSKLDEAVVKAEPKKEEAPSNSETESKRSEGSGGKSQLNAGAQADLWSRYGSVVRQAILDRFSYPPASRTLGETGRVKIAFVVLTDGTLCDVRVSQPSAFDRLNHAALNMVQRVARVDPLPVPGLNRWSTEIAIDFTLN